ncbi:adenine nucleotide alpha hydrolases-likesuperfamily protein [Striga asiatica]|uniref:Adenine nucleotide alpha hydrolases-likesuperfamily protein n=1 Tax=Striga asiatica TaxID=4170 RepID=A0A5A7P315_STRAF|nr:adenine nucleotide alpha hydrolases-likesuperfamily protein [Striga asiatica]
MVIESVKKAQEENATNILSRALHICKEKKVKAETLILQGDPKDKICQAAEELGVDLLVVGSRGLGTIKRALLGSVSNYCVHHVHCPVLIVKPPPKQAHD